MSRTIENLKKLKSFHNGSYGADIDKAIKALKTLEEFEKAQIITGGRLNGRTYAYKCGLEDGKCKALEQALRWIPCSERLPKKGEYDGDVAKYYLVQNEYGDMLVARYTHSEYWEQIYQLKPIADEIIAWCELPQPYTDE